jgi:hypothetical protein
VESKQTDMSRTVIGTETVVDRQSSIVVALLLIVGHHPIAARVRLMEYTIQMRVVKATARIAKSVNVGADAVRTKAVEAAMSIVSGHHLLNVGSLALPAMAMARRSLSSGITACPVTISGFSAARFL